MAVFDRRLLRLRRDRAAATLAGHDFLFSEVAGRLIDRLDDVRRQFPLALDVGCHDGQLGRRRSGANKIGRLVEIDLSAAMLARAGRSGVVADEEALPFADATFDLILSGCSLHWVNDLPGVLVQLRQALRPDGLLLAAMFGGDTLCELRQSWLAAEAAQEDGAGPRISPFVDLRDAAGLLQRAGFALPVADTDRITATYDNPMQLMSELQGMGEANTRLDRRHVPTRRNTLLAAAEHYTHHFSNPDGRVRATFQIVYLTGWAPHPAQPRAARRGSATARLATALATTEQSAGATADRPA